LFGPEEWGKLKDASQDRNRRVMLRWEEITQAVPRMTDLFKDLIIIFIMLKHHLAFNLLSA